MKKIFNLLKQYREVISYLFWGGMTTVVGWGSYSLIVTLLKERSEMVGVFGLNISMAVLQANVWSWICAVLFAFVTNKIWVFQSKNWSAKVVMPELGKFVSARIVTGVLEIIAVPLLVGIGLNQTLFGIEGMVAKVIVSVLVVILNYVFSKLIVFR